MRCPECRQAEIKEHVSIKGLPFFKKKLVYYYCPLCKFENEREFKLSPDDLKLERQKQINQQEIDLLRAKNRREKIETKDSKFKHQIKRR